MLSDIAVTEKGLPGIVLRQAFGLLRIVLIHTYGLLCTLCPVILL